MGIVLIYSISTRSQWPLVILGQGNNCMFPSPLTEQNSLWQDQAWGQALDPKPGTVRFPLSPIPITKCTLYNLLFQV